MAEATEEIAVLRADETREIFRVRRLKLCRQYGGIDVLVSGGSSCWCLVPPIDSIVALVLEGCETVAIDRLEG